MKKHKHNEQKKSGSVPGIPFLRGTDLHDWLHAHKAQLQKRLRGVDKLIKLLPEDDDIHAALLR